MKILTLSQIKWELSNFLLDNIGFDAEPFIDRVNNANSVAEIHNIVTYLLTSTKLISEKQLMAFWLPLSKTIKK